MTSDATDRSGLTDPFRAEVFLNPYLAAGSGAVDAIVTVTAAGEPEEPDVGPRAEVVIIDCSGSMYGNRKLQRAKEAAAAAINCLDEGTSFAVIAGNHRARLVYPDDGTVRASDATRKAARTALAGLEADGGTSIGTWLDLARQVVEPLSATRHATLLTDGKNVGQSPGRLAESVDACRGLFQCDCLGIGEDWDVEELRGIAEALLGTVEYVRDPGLLAEGFRDRVRASLARTFPDVRLRLWTPQGATPELVAQVAPEVVELTDRATEIDERTRDFLLGGWAPGETRDYHLRIQVRPHMAGERIRAGRVELLTGDGEPAGRTTIEAEWTDDRELSTRIDRHVAHYTNQQELSEAIRSGLAALEEGDERTATVKLARAAEIARASGHEQMLQELAGVVEVDPTTGTVRLRRHDRSDRIRLGTVRLRASSPKPDGEATEALANPGGAPSGPRSESGDPNDRDHDGHPDQGNDIGQKNDTDHRDGPDDQFDDPEEGS